MRLQWLQPKRGQNPPDSSELERIGVVHRRLAVDAEATRSALDALKTARGYIAEDEVALGPQTPDLDALLTKFAKEHRHDDDEVRYVLEGEGIFDIRSTEDDWLRVTVEQGDLIVVPGGCYHRFFLTDGGCIRCIRLFKDSSGWVPHYRDLAAT